MHAGGLVDYWACGTLQPRLGQQRTVSSKTAKRPAARSIGITTLARVDYARLRKCRMGAEAQLWTAMYRRCCAGYYWNYNSLQGTAGYYRVLQGTVGTPGYCRLLQGTIGCYRLLQSAVYWRYV